MTHTDDCHDAAPDFEPIGPHHAPLFHGLNANPQAMRYFPDALSADETETFIARIVAHRARYGFGLEVAVLAETRIFAGFIGLLRAEFDAPFTPAVEVGWRLATEFRGQGLAPEGARGAGMRVRRNGVRRSSVIHGAGERGFYSRDAKNRHAA